MVGTGGMFQHILAVIRTEARQRLFLAKTLQSRERKQLARTVVLPGSIFRLAVLKAVGVNAYSESILLRTHAGQVQILESVLIELDAEL